MTNEDLMATAQALKAVNRQVCEEFCRQVNLLYVAVLPHPTDTPEQVLEILSILINNGQWPGYLFQCREVWEKYILSITEEKYHNAMSMIMQLGVPDDLIVYLRACYRFGYQVVGDVEYDALERLYLKTFPALSYLNKEVNEDTTSYSVVVQEAIKLSVSKSVHNAAKSAATSSQTGAFAALNAEKSTSIMPVRSYGEAYVFLKKAPVCRTHWSLKMDGFNTKVLCKEDGSGLEIAMSRGRASDSWDYTEALRLLFKAQGVDVSKLHGKITGESLVDAQALDYLRAKYPTKEYKSPKSTAGAMLRAPQQFEENDYKYLHFYPFEYGEIMKDEAFKQMRAAGLTPPPEIIIESGAIPLDCLEGFGSWLDQTILDPLWKMGGERQGESDGVVLQLLTTVENDRADKYSDLNVALKFSHWTESQYTSVVRRIIFEQQRVMMSVVLEVDPVTTRDLNVATRVSVGSPAILVNDGVKVGDRIAFTRKSEAINVYDGRIS